MLSLSPGRRDLAARSERSSGGTRGDARRSHGSLDTRAGRGEAHPFPAGECRRVVRRDSLNDSATLVTRRSEQLFEQRLGDPLGVVRRIDDQEIDRSDVATGANGRSEGEDRTTDNGPPSFGDNDAGLRQVDELAEEIGRTERALTTTDAQRFVAQGNKTLDIGDTGRSDQVFHADGSNLAGPATMVLDRGSTEMTPGPAIRSSAGERTTLAAQSEDAADRYCIQVADA